MNRRHEIGLLIVALAGGLGFGFTVSPLLCRISPLFSVAFCAVLFVCFSFWLLHDIQKEMLIRDQERADVEKHRRKKQSVILRSHPLLESSKDEYGIRNMDDLDRYFDQYVDEVSEMDWDKNGQYIFKDHKYIW